MATIDFESSAWPSTVLCDEGGPGNTLVDQSSGINLIIADGSMQVEQMPAGSNHYLAFSRQACDGTIRPVTTLVIRFPEGMRRVVFRTSFEQAPNPMLISFYKHHGMGELVESRQIPWSSGFYWVRYLGDCVEEIAIRSAGHSNCFDDITFQVYPNVHIGDFITSWIQWPLEPALILWDGIKRKLVQPRIHVDRTHIESTSEATANVSLAE